MGRGARWILAVAAVGPGLWLSGCGGYESAYERAVYNHEPVYCYRTVGDVDCYREADANAERRLVNYYGPSPRRAERPEAAEIRLDPPPEAVPGREPDEAGEPSACAAAAAGCEGGAAAGARARDERACGPAAGLTGEGMPRDLTGPGHCVWEGRG